MTGDGRRTARWALLMENPPGPGAWHLFEQMATVEGTHEEAVERFGEFVRLYRPKHPRYPVRVRRFRTGNGWMVIGDGSSGGSFPYRFSIAELEWDSGPIAY
ncbi:hypothetical protein [Streptomyces sp. MZ04]|uniref:hypothetical protein n=1 Tax=Streptomyces sp. MZ04 TaxID=2559236 RepID=UPI00107E89F1|nr:hypothetical protein [Streptomyces sp. MZ04]TGB08219.1 hypothetical protein E2651_19930 [Streptomyces sp. MZ04]